MYGSGRYLTLTGFHLPETPAKVESRQRELDRFVRATFESKPDRKSSYDVPDPERVEEALKYVNPDERDDWLRVGMGLHSELGARGRSIWDSWSGLIRLNV